jgi:hypothetical protein
MFWKTALNIFGVVFFVTTHYQIQWEAQCKWSQCNQDQPPSMNRCIIVPKSTIAKRKKKSLKKRRHRHLFFFLKGFFFSS